MKTFNLKRFSALGVFVVFWCVNSMSHADAVPLVPEGTLQGAQGSTVGPGGDLFVTEGALGQISRVDPQTGEVTTFAGGLPLPVIGIGGAVDVAFIGSTAYALVTLIGDPLFGSQGIDGIYRMERDGSWSVFADLGTYSANNLPTGGWDFFLVNGVQYAMEVYRGGFLVTDGHHNRVLRVAPNGDVSEFFPFDNIVPTGLAVSGNSVYMAQAGATPHDPADGKVVLFDARSPMAMEVASGAPLPVDVEFGRGRTLFALAQGDWTCCEPGDPADPDTGSLVQVTSDGTFNVVEQGLNQPTSMEVIQNHAYIVSLTGGIWVVADIADAPFGKARGR